MVMEEEGEEGETTTLITKKIITKTITSGQEVQVQPEQEKTITTTTTTQQLTDTAPGTKSLTITKKGAFFDDSFFEDSRQYFQTAVKQVLQKCNETSTQADDITTYRNLRQRELKDETQAVTECDSENVHRIIVDVQDFVSGGEVTVKTVDEREVVIEGCIEKQEGNTRSIKRFCKRFILEDDIQVDSVTSVVSSDGILTITAPRKPSQQQLPDVSQSVSIKKTTTTQQQTSTITTGQQEIQVEPEQEKTITTTTTTTQQLTDTAPGTKSLTIIKKGAFFDDSFFEDSRQYFQTAVKQVLQKCNETSTQADDITTYRNLRQRELKDETQAVTECDSENVHRIIVDVQDFVSGGEVTVKTVDEREVVIEGCIEKQEGNTRSIKRFCKRFILEDDIQVDSVTSVVSSDGILTITAPRKPSQQQLPDVSQSVSIKKTTTTQQQTSTITTGQQEIQVEPEQEKTITTTTTRQVQAVTDTAPLPETKEENQTVSSVVTEQNISKTSVVQVQQQTTDVSQTQTTDHKTITIQVQEPEVEEIKKTTTTKTTTVLTEEPEPEETKKTTTTTTTTVQQQEPEPQEPKTTTTTTTTTRVVTISKKGPFFSDPDFVETVKDFESSIKTVLQKLNITVTETNFFTVYRENRKKEPKNENQAVSQVDNEKFMRVVIDVCDFLGTVTVKLVEGKEIVVEGSGTNEKGGTFSFCRRYTLYSDTDTENITAVISSEGVLVITIPRKQTTHVTTVKKEVKEQEVKKETTDVTQTQTTDQKTTTVQKQEPEPQEPKTTTTMTTTTRVVTITKKGPFFSDPDFAETVKDFESSIKTVVKKLNITVTETNFFTVYREHRKKEPKNENQAISQVDNEKFMRVVIDVCDFLGTVTVKLVEGKEIVVEGSGTNEKGGTYSFCRRYTLYSDTDTENITAVISSEGILVITIPRKQTTQVSTVTTEKKEVKKETTDVTQTQTSDQKTTTVEIQEPEIEEIKKTTTTKTTTVLKEEPEPQETKKTTTTTTTVQKQEPEIEETKDTTTTKTTTVLKEEPEPQETKKTTTTITTVQEQEPEPQETKTTTTTTTTTRVVTITKKGPFFSDPEFVETVKDFETSIKTLVKKLNITVTETNFFTVYREHRKKEPKNENQAISQVDNEKFMRVVMDVCDFLGTVTVKLVEGKEIVVEGSSTNEKGCTYSFCRHYTLYINTDTENITAVISSEGVLVITIPRKQTTQVSTGTIVKETTDISQTQTTDQKTTTVQIHEPEIEEIKKTTITKTTTVLKEEPEPQETKKLTTTTTTTVQQQEPEPKELMTTTTTTTTTRVITISKKGPFFSDPDFTDTVKDFETSIKTLVKKLNITVTETNFFTVYREYRKKEPRNENQAVSKVDNEKFMRVVIDVCDFLGTVTVKLVEGKEIVVEGSGTNEKGGTYSFCRRYTLYSDTDTENITAVISSEGVLVITIPRKQTTQVSTVTTEIKEAKKETTDVTQTQTTDQKTTTVQIQEPEIEEIKKTTTTKTTTVLKEEPEPQETKKTTTTTTTVQKQEPEIEETKDTTTTKTTTVLEEEPEPQETKTTTTTTTVQKQEPEPKETKTTTTTTTTTRVVTITKKGPFFSDPDFVETVKDFETSIKTLVKKLNITVTETNFFTVYREHRKKEPKNENQAISQVDNEKFMRVVMDMCDFLGTITVKLVEGKEIVVEGSGTNEKGGTYSFCGRYTLYSDTDTENITAVISSEGVLVITIPRKQTTQVSTVTIVKETTDISQAQTTDQKTTTVQIQEPEIEEIKKTTITKTTTVLKEEPEPQETKKITTTLQQQEPEPQELMTTTTTTTTTRVITISKKGPFFSDPDFTDTVKDFETSIKTLVKKLNITVTETNFFTVYREHRKKELRNENQAVSKVDNEKFMRVVIDVCDFLGTVTVKLIEGKEIVVEGSGTNEKGGTYSFCRRYTLYSDTDTENITAVISSEGVLVITIPRKQATQLTTVKKEVKEQEVKRETTDVTQTQTTDQKTTTVQIQEPEIEEIKKTTITKTTTVVKEEPEPQETKKTTTTTMQQQEPEPQDPKMTTTTTTTTQVITISKKGPFFSDPDFTETVKDFETSIKTLVKKLNITVTETNFFTVYREYRKKEPRNENQAVSKVDNEKFMRVVIDVCDFLGTVTVKLIEGKEIVAEGSGTNEKGGIYSFCRRYTLYSDTDTENISAMISSEGVLVIAIPRKQATQLTTVKKEMKEQEVKRETTDVTQTQTTDQKTTTVQIQEPEIEEIKKTTITKTATVLKEEPEPQETKKTTTTTMQQQEPEPQEPKTTTTTTTTTRVITISKKGPFFSDPDFTETVKDFETSIKTLVKKLNITVTEMNFFTVYREYRKKEPRNENQAVSKVDNEKFMRVVIDVCDFLGTVTVKLIEGKEIVVEGSGTNEKGGTYSFCRRYTLYSDTDTENINAVISSEGVLVITIPRKQDTQLTTVKKEVKKQEVKRETTDVTQTQTTDQKTTTVQIQEPEIEEIKKTTITKTTTVLKEEPEPQETKKTTTTTTTTVQQQEPEPQELMTTTTTTTTTRVITISKKGPFFSDPDFTETVKDFETSIKTLVKKLNITVTETNFFTVYREHRKKEPKNENQAVSKVDNEKFMRVVIDVCDFLGTVTVKLIEGKEIVVEGSGTNEKGGTYSFCRRYTLYSDTDTENITAVISSEGVLVITIPRKQTTQITTVKKEVKEQEVKRETTDVTQTQTTDQKTTTVQIQEPSIEEIKKTTITKTTTVLKEESEPEETKKTTTTTTTTMQQQEPEPQEPKTTTTTTTTTRVITISKKGPFFSDPDFTETVKDFETSIKILVKKLKITVTETNFFTVYREHRKKEPRNENQAVSKVDNEKFMRVVIDVCDFLGTVTVKLIEGKEIVVEGSGTNEKGGTYSFCRRYTLYSDTDTENITAVISSEGVLVITIPRKQTTQLTTVKKEVKEQEVKRETTDVTQTQTTDQKTTTVQIQEPEIDEIKKTTITKTTTMLKEEPEPQETKKTTTTTTTTMEQQEPEPQELMMTTTTTTTTRVIAISKKGPFFSDPDFTETVKDFETSIKTLVKKLKITVTETNFFTVYREHRKKEPRNENQAVSKVDNEKFMRVVIDVCDFLGTVTVKLVEGKEIVVEGSGTNEKGGTYSFCRRYTLYSDTDTENITAVISSEGVLVITIPRKQTTQVTTEKKEVKEQEVKETVTEKKEVTEQEVKDTVTTVQKEVKEQEVKKETTDVTQTTDQKTTTVQIQEPEIEEIKKTTTTKTTTVQKEEPEPQETKKTTTTKTTTVQKEEPEPEETKTTTTKTTTVQKEEPEPQETKTTTTKTTTVQKEEPEPQETKTTTTKTTTVQKEEPEPEETKKTTTTKKTTVQKEEPEPEETKKTTTIKKTTVQKEEPEPEETKKTTTIKKTTVQKEEPEPEETKKTTTIKKTTVQKEEPEPEETKKTTTIKKTTVQKEEPEPEETKKTTTTKKTTVQKKEPEPEETKKTTTTTTTTTRVVTVSKKGPFFSDPDFAETVKDFETSIKTLVKKLKITVTETNFFTVYREHRKKEPKNENQAISQVDNEKFMRVVMDVCDFLDTVTVKLVEGKEIVVEGTGKNPRGGTFSFCRRYTLYSDTDTENITAVISSEGVLVITIPRKQTTQVSTVKKEVKEQVKKDTTDVTQAQKTTTVKQQEADTQQSKKTTTTTTTTTRVVTLTKKGPFFSDPEFTETVKDFRTSIKTVMTKLKIRVTETNMFTVYRDTRKKDPKNENQAISQEDNEKFMRVVMDVCDFLDTVTVKLVEGKEIVVEGTGKNPKGGTFSFCRRYTLYSDTDTENITAVISSEGVLVITIPRKQTTQVSTVKKEVKEQVKKDTTDVTQAQKTTTVKQQEADTQQTKKTTTTTTTTTRVVTLTKKGPFFSDPEFTETVKDFRTSIKTVMTKLKIRVTETNMFTVYRDTRKKDPKNENQAISQEDNEKFMRVVMDVCDFLDTVTVKLVEGKEIVVEGTGKNPKGGTFSFCRRYTLYSDTDTENITAVISSEGVLVITIPRKQTTQVSTVKKEVKEQVKKDTTDVTQAQKTTTVKQQEADTQQSKKTTTTTTTTTRVVTITKKGPFFSDPEFTETVKDFRTSIKTVMTKLKIRVTETNMFTVYRDTRKKDPKNENQAISQEDNEKFMRVVMDVCDFLDNLTVKLVEGKEVVVEGTGKNPRGGTFNFCRRFTLYSDTDTENITAVISSEGILTITMPRKQTTTMKQQEADTQQSKKTTTTTTTTTRVVTITKKGPFFSDPEFTETVKDFRTSIKTVMTKLKIRVTETNMFTVYRDTRKKNPKNENQAISQVDNEKFMKVVIDVCDFGTVTVKVVEGKEIIVEGTGTNDRGGTYSTCRRYMLYSDTVLENITAVMSSEGVLVLTMPRKQQSSEGATSVKKKETTTMTSSTTRIVKITVKGAFFSDTSFTETVKEFKSCIKTVTQKFNIKTTEANSFNAYREYRKKDPKNENQAMSHVDNEKFMRVVMDVCDFLGGVTVKLVEGKEVVVEGKGNREKGGSVVSFSFNRRFTLYEDTDLEGITAVMSSEGVLVITIPRKK